MFPELRYLAALVDTMRRRVVRDPEAGASTMEWVVITAIVVTAALVAGSVFLARVRYESNKFRPGR